MRFREGITVKGVDGAALQDLGAVTNFPVVNISGITAGAGSQTLDFTRTHSVPRSALQEDPAVFPIPDADEIRCSVQIEPTAYPSTVSHLTDGQVTLPG